MKRRPCGVVQEPPEAAGAKIGQKIVLAPGDTELGDESPVGSQREGVARTVAGENAALRPSGELETRFHRRQDRFGSPLVESAAAGDRASRRGGGAHRNRENADEVGDERAALGDRESVARGRADLSSALRPPHEAVAGVRRRREGVRRAVHKVAATATHRSARGRRYAQRHRPLIVTGVATPSLLASA